MRELQRTLRGIADPAFATDERQRIVAWNEAATRLLGHDAREVTGKPCHGVVCGVDLFGNRVCDEDCQLSRMARRGEPIGSFEMNVRKESGEVLTVACSVLTIAIGRPVRRVLIHVFRPIERNGDTRELLHRLLGWAATGADPGPSPTAHRATRLLTEREMEVLGRLAEGKRNREVAQELAISLSTVRTHIRNILGKLEAHSKLEAVSLALRRHLI